MEINRLFGILFTHCFRLTDTTVSKHNEFNQFMRHPEKMQFLLQINNYTSHITVGHNSFFWRII